MRHSLLSACALAALATAATPAFAQTPGPDQGDQLGAVVVTGSRYRAEREIDAKRRSDIVVDSLSSDDIGAVPDFNIPDALRRISGVTAQFDEDEGRFVNIRGVDANLNVVTLDGLSLPSSGDFGGTGRAVDLEFLPSNSVKRLEIYKTFTPDLDGGSVGGQVNLVTRSAFDKPGFSLVGRATVSHYELTQVPGKNTLPKRGEATLTDRFGPDGKFGLVLTGLYQIRPRDQVKFFSVGALSGFPRITPADRFNTTIYGNDQSRYGGNGKLEYKSGGAYAFVSAYWYKQAETETRYVDNLQIRATEVTETGPTTGRASQALNNITADYFPIQTQGRGVQGLVDQRFGQNGHLFGTVGYSLQTFDHETPALAFQTARVAGLGFDFDTSSLVQTRKAVADPAYFANLANYTANLARYRDLHTQEGLLDAKLNYAWNAEAGAQGFGFKAGGEYRRLRRWRDNEQFDLSAADRARLKLSDFILGETFASSYQPEPFLLIDTKKMQDYFKTAALVRDPAASTTADFVYLEKIASGFAMATYTAPGFKAIVGLRYEHTDFGADAAGRSNVVGGKFGDWLPSLNLRYDLAPGLALRAAYSRTLGRPNPGDLAATTTVTPAASDAPVDVIVARGNPDLQPRRVNNFDLSIERYFDQGNGLVSAAVFYKDIKGDIFQLRTRGDYQGQRAEFRQNINAVGSKVKGVELTAVLARMRFLPGAFSGLGVSANLTLLEGEMNIPAQGTGNDITVTASKLDRRIGQPKLLANAALSYSWKGRLEARVAWNRTGMFLTSLTQAEAAYEQIDASIRYRLTPHIFLSAEGRNLTSADRVQLTNVNDFNFLFGTTQIDRSFHFSVGVQF